MTRIKTIVMMRRQPAILGLAALLVALLVMPSSAAVKTSVEPRGGTWKGTTAQGLPIEFVVKKKPKGWKVLSAEYQVTSTCTGSLPPGPATATREFPVRRGDGTVDGDNQYAQRRNTWVWGHFGGGDVPGGTETNLSVLRGKFLDKKKARGTLRDEKEQHYSGFDLVCSSGTVRWTARG